MKNLKLVLVTTCFSFTLVVLINCFFDIFISMNELKTIDILQIATICLMVSIGIYLGACHTIFKEHFYLVGYIIMLVIVFVMEWIFRGEFSLQNCLLEAIALTFVYVGVYFLAFHENEKDADIINQKIQNRKNRNE